MTCVDREQLKALLVGHFSLFCLSTQNQTDFVIVSLPFFSIFPRNPLLGKMFKDVFFFVCFF